METEDPYLAGLCAQRDTLLRALEAEESYQGMYPGSIDAIRSLEGQIDTLSTEIFRVQSGLIHQSVKDQTDK